MWILERAAARTRDDVVRCPDTDTTGISLQWELQFGVDAIEVQCDEQVVTSAIVDGQTECDLTRQAGDQLAVIGRRGRTRVGDPSGTWVRTLGPDDVLVLEGEDEATVRCAPELNATWTAVHLRAVADPLPWIP